MCNESTSSHCKCKLIKIQLSVCLLFTLMIIWLIVVFLPTENWMKEEICILTEHAARENNKWKSKARFPDDCMQRNLFAWEFTLSITPGSLPWIAFFWWKWYTRLIFLRRKSVMFKRAQNLTLLKAPRQQGRGEPGFGCVNSTCSIPWYQPDLCDDFLKKR